MRWLRLQHLLWRRRARGPEWRHWFAMGLAKP